MGTYPLLFDYLTTKTREMSKTFIILLVFILYSICCLIIYYAMYKYLFNKWIKEYNKSYPNINYGYYKQRQEK